MTDAADCVERMIRFRQRCPGAEFDLKPNLFTARVPGRDEPFRSMSLCKLMNVLERCRRAGLHDIIQNIYRRERGTVILGAHVSVMSHPGPATA